MERQIRGSARGRLPVAKSLSINPLPFLSYHSPPLPYMRYSISIREANDALVTPPEFPIKFTAADPHLRGAETAYVPQPVYGWSTPERQLRRADKGY
ncbi:hypothetical protein EVAR_51029_1 [Eumeta japonica]|uniref:Uncharacterized protein n=1 Tax=Eumeta variegata TaxID=151549 RepID=A0A4C1Y5E8_EUMVA|nr:hypothetical protein EVAR_51029_1 [Eumeta japonica]